MDETQRPTGAPDGVEPHAPSAAESAAEAAAVARLAAADPARTAEPDTATLRAAVDARRLSSPTDELVARRLRRLTTWPARAAAVAAAALVVGGGGGYVIGAAGSGGGPELAGAPIVLQAPGTGPAGAGLESSTERLTGMALEESAQMASGSAQADDGRLAGADMAYGWYGRTVFHASGLPDEAGTARAWALDASGAVSAEAAARAAVALGVAGEPRQEYGSWVVGSNDGTGATLQLAADGVASLSVWDPTKDVWYCDPMAAEERAAREDSAGSDEPDEPDEPDGAGVDPAPAPLPDPCGQRDLGAAPSTDAATAALREAMTAVGVDLAAFRFTASDGGDPAYTHVTAVHVVDGQQTGLSWSASFSGAGMTGLYGFTATLVDLGTYDVVSPADAVARLNDPRFGAGWAGPILMADTVRSGAEGGIDLPGDTAVAPPEEPDVVPPAPAGAGDAFAWPVQDVTIVDARLGVAQLMVRGGAAVLAPSYELTGADGSVWSVIAVAERHLDLSAD